MRSSPDVIGIGEVLVEFTRAADNSWSSGSAGDILNTCFYLARSGVRTGLVTRFGSDPHTTSILQFLEEEGIDRRFARVSSSAENGRYYVSTNHAGERSFRYERAESAARQLLRELDPEPLFRYCSRARLLYLTGVTLAVVQRSDQLSRLLARVKEESSAVIAFDPNVRPSLWASLEEARERMERFIPLVDIFLPSAEDITLLWGAERDREELWERMGLDHVVETRGEMGAILWRDGVRQEFPLIERRSPLDTTGAGDGFNAGYLAGVLKGWESERSVRAGEQVASRVVGVRGAIDSTYRWEE